MPSARAKLAAAVGQLVLTHNFAHASFVLILCHLVGNGSLAQTLWHTQRSDKAQRDLVSAALRDPTTPKSRLFSRSVSWALKKMDALSELRNDVVHADHAIDVQVKPYVVKFNPFSTAPSRVQRLQQEVKLTRSMQTATGDLAKLGEYVWCLWSYGSNEGRVPLPRRPRLRFARGRYRRDFPYPYTLL